MRDAPTPLARPSTDETDDYFLRRVRRQLFAARGKGRWRECDADARLAIMARRWLRVADGWTLAEQVERMTEIRGYQEEIARIEREAAPVNRDPMDRAFSRRAAQRDWSRLLETDWWDVVREVGIVSLGPERVESLRALFDAARQEGEC